MSHELEPVVRKARSYLRTSSALLTAALVLVSVVLVVLQHQAAVRKANFDSNSNVHLVSIGSRVVDGRTDSLSPADLATVRDLVRNTPGGSRALVSPRLTLGPGLPSSTTETSFHIVGLDPAAGSLIGVAPLVDGVAYTVAGAPGPLTLDIPVITSSGSDGMSSDRLDHLTVTRSPTAHAGNVRYLEGLPDGATYVSTNTFWQIAEKMLRMNRAKIEQAAAAGKLPMIPLANTIYVEIPDLQRVRTTAATLEEAGYGVDFALRAFDAIEQQVLVERALGIVLGLVALGGAGGYVLVSWRSYLRLSRRDIGILRHWSIEPAQIRRLYARQLRSALRLPLVVAAGVAWVGSISLTGGAGAQAAALDTVALGAVAGVLYGCVVRLVIHPWTTRDVLTLLRSEREFQ